MKKNILIWVTLTIWVFMLNKNVFSWDNEKTHRDLSKYAAENSVLSKTKADYLKNVGFDKGLDEIFIWNNIGKDVKKWLQDGAELEDAGSFSDYVYGKARSFNHFHNPMKPWDSAGLDDYITIPNPIPPFIPLYINIHTSGESALQWAQDKTNQQSYSESKGLQGDQTWQTIRNYYYYALTGKTDLERQGYFARVFKGIGHQIHLIQDMSVPAHVRNDAHPEDAILGKNHITGDFYFETWAKNNVSKINSFASTPIFPQFDLTENPGGMIPISQFYDTDQYNENVVPTKSLTWGLSEYTNANFVSDDTIFTEKFSKNDGHYFPYPRYTDQSQCYEQFDQDIAPNKKRTYWRKKCVGEAVEHFVTAGPLFKYLPIWDLQRLTLKLDEATHNDYADKLVPRAVGYSAGLLNYFFRGDMKAVNYEVVKDGSGNIIDIKMKVRNLTQNEAMGPQKDIVTGQIKGQGKFIISYQYKISGSDVYGTSNEVQLNENIDSGKESTSEFTFNFTPSIPSEVEGIKYWLVYRGKLGNEEDTVAGKTVELKEPEYLFLINQKRFMSQLISVIQLFEIKTLNGSYQLTPVEREINIEGIAHEESGASVQSNDLHDKHFMTYASWLSKIGQWGVDSGTLGCYRPESFEENTAYKYFLSDEDLPEGWNKYCTGRHNFTVQDSVLQTHSETVASKQGASPSLYGKGQDGWQLLKTLEEETITQDENIQESEVSCDSGTTGDFGEWFWGNMTYNFTGYSYTASMQCSGGGTGFMGEKVHLVYIATAFSDKCLPYYKASIGQGKVLTLFERYLWESKNERKAIWGSSEENKTSVSTIRYFCYIGNPQDVENTYTSRIRSEKFFTYHENNSKYTIETKLKIGDYEVDNALYSVVGESLGKDEDLGEGEWILYKHYTEASASPVSGPCTTYWYPADWGPPVVTETVTENYNSIPKNWERRTYNGGRLELVDYDNLNGDESFICIYSKSYIDSVWEWTEGEDEEDFFTAPTETVEYFLAYKVKGDATIHKVSLGQNIKYTSCQMDDKTMVYTYIVENNGIFNKRVVGVLNNSDSALPIGYRQEFELDFSGTDFDPKGLAAIGVTK